MTNHATKTHCDSAIIFAKEDSPAEKVLRGIVFRRVQKKKILQKDPVHREPLERRRAPEEPGERRGLPKAEVAVNPSTEG
jgi:hypothetical protein